MGTRGPDLLAGLHVQRGPSQDEWVRQFEVGARLRLMIAASRRSRRSEASDATRAQAKPTPRATPPSG